MERPPLLVVPVPMPTPHRLHPRPPPPPLPPLPPPPPTRRRQRQAHPPRQAGAGARAPPPPPPRAPPLATPPCAPCSCRTRAGTGATPPPTGTAPRTPRPPPCLSRSPARETPTRGRCSHSLPAWCSGRSCGWPAGAPSSPPASGTGPACSTGDEAQTRSPRHGLATRSPCGRTRTTVRCCGTTPRPPASFRSHSALPRHDHPPS
mmetsp:Transcript_7353/g.23178  ORF Transcript_7353/g.23178 Transcript_7353/m.23178 type:complete len:205 (-) Transcript_7353:261-875(-)